LTERNGACRRFRITDDVAMVASEAEHCSQPWMRERTFVVEPSSFFAAP